LRTSNLAILGPLILTANLILLLRGEVVLDVEGLADLLGRLALDHVCDSLASDIKQCLDIKVIGGQNDLEKHLLIHLHELLVPLLYVGCLFTGVGIVFVAGRRVMLVMLAPLDNFLEDCSVDIGDRNCFVHGFFSEIADHVLDQD